MHAAKQQQSCQPYTGGAIRLPPSRQPPATLTPCRPRRAASVRCRLCVPPWGRSRACKARPPRPSRSSSNRRQSLPRRRWYAVSPLLAPARLHDSLCRAGKGANLRCRCLDHALRHLQAPTTEAGPCCWWGASSYKRALTARPELLVKPINVTRHSPQCRGGNGGVQGGDLCWPLCLRGSFETRCD